MVLGYIILIYLVGLMIQDIILGYIILIYLVGLMIQDMVLEIILGYIILET